MGIPIVLHEQNTIPGRSTSLMAKKAARICLVFESSRKHFPEKKTVITGMPVRQSLVDAAAAKADSSVYSTLISGGSQGAEAINNLVPKLIKQLPSDATYVHITGRNLYDSFVAADHDLPANYKAFPYLEELDIGRTLAAASFAIVRGGCGTIAELAMFGIPAIYIPLPTSFANHQYHNAKEIESVGGGTVIEQSDANPELLADTWTRWFEDKERRRIARENLSSWSEPNATEHIFSVIKDVFDENQG
jgi:UDP-N-acetylglucosamine--N-acetylmuramyl-(pentapeptide) pyrophosphoryl-undecaprenol N-acetylglucosamine transferase